MDQNFIGLLIALITVYIINYLSLYGFVTINLYLFINNESPLLGDGRYLFFSCLIVIIVGDGD